MPTYQTVLIGRPKDWQPRQPDDVPPGAKSLLGQAEVLCQGPELFEALQRAIDEYRRAMAEGLDRWALVVETPGDEAVTLMDARLCMPVEYAIAAVWWPGGWEPSSPLDVPNCILQAHAESGRRLSSYRQAVAAMVALNRQCMAQPGTSWYVVVAIEAGAISKTVSWDAAGTETTALVRRLHVVRPERGGRGDCAFCPAHALPCCGQADATDLVRTVTVGASDVCDKTCDG